MNYFLFENGDVVGPFPVQELQQREGFSAGSLVCPQDHSEDEEYWKAAQEYAEFGFSAPIQKEEITPAAETKTETFGSAMAAAVQDMAPLADIKTDLRSLDPSQTEDTSAATPAAQPPKEEGRTTISESLDRLEQVLTEEESSSVQAAGSDSSSDIQKGDKAFPVAVTEIRTQTISQMSPIEEYFNTMRSGDLGNILGMPDPNANSDMNLASVLEKQFEKTDPNAPEPLQKERDPFDDFSKPQESAEEEKKTTPDEADHQTEVQLYKELEQQPLKEEADAVDKEPHAAAELETEGAKQPTAQPEPDTTLSSEELVPAAAEVKKRETMPALGEKEETEEQDWMNEPTEPVWKKWLTLGLILLILAGLAYEGWVYRVPLSKQMKKVMDWAHQKDKTVSAAPITTQSETTSPGLTATAAPAAPVRVPTPSVLMITKTPEEQAKDIVQQHVLDKERGTVLEYLGKRYAKELANGYAANWSAELLHKNVYVVKYRLAKTRKEPIVYIFQADTAKKKLTGALNNITLDLVGKIN